MKFRPYVNLRFRSEAQDSDVRSRAAQERISLNEWLLLQIEKANPGLVGQEPVSVAKTVKTKGKSPESTSGGCSECGAVSGVHQRGCSKGKK